MPVFACSRPCDEICKKKEVGEDENPKKVLGAANASRANDKEKKMPKQRSYITRRAAGHNFEVPGYWRFAIQSFNFRVGRSTVCAIIKETCATIWIALKDTYLKSPEKKED